MFRLSSFSVVGFSGSRSVVPAAAVQLALGRVAPSACVFVGCAGGVDGFVRSGWSGSVRVFSVASVGFSGRGAFAVRSAACVRAVAAAGGAWVSFPSAPCPVGVVPSGSPFRGAGSGSWASLALAVFLGVPSLVFAPFGVPGGWGFVSLGRGWWLFPGPVAAQLPLF